MYTFFFQGDIQELKFYSTPDSAYEICSDSTYSCTESKNNNETLTNTVNVDETEESTFDSNFLNKTSVVRVVRIDKWLIIYGTSDE